MTMWPPEAYVFGLDGSGPPAVLSGRACARLERLLRLDEVRIRVRGQNPELDNALAVIHVAATAWRSGALGSARGTVVAATAEPAPQSALSTQDAADRLGLTARAVRKAAKAKRLRGTQRDGRWYFELEDVELYRTRR